MSKMIRKDVNETYAYSGSIKAGEYVFLNFCVGNVGKSTEEQVEGALIEMQKRLEAYDLDLDAVVKVTVMMRDAWDIPTMEKVFKRYFKNGYPVRKTIQTEFAHKGGIEGLKIQIDGIAYCGS